MVGATEHDQASNHSQDHARMTVTVFKCEFCTLLLLLQLGLHFSVNVQTRFQLLQRDSLVVCP